MLRDNKPHMDPRLLIHASVRGIAVASAFFSLIVGILITITYFQLSTIDPVNSMALTQLYEQYNNDPDDESLKGHLRSLDLLARRSFFTARWQIQTGGYLLAGGTGLTIICLVLMDFLRKKIPVPGKGFVPTRILGSRFLARWLVLALSGSFFLFSFVFAFIVEDRIEKTLSAQETTDSHGIRNTMEEEPEGWTCFRGKSSTGIAPAGNYPMLWNGNSGEGILWKQALPLEGFNSPIVYEGKVFLSAASGESLLVLCLDVETGGFLWQQEVKDKGGVTTVFPEVSADTGYAAPSLATDGSRIFALFGTGDLVCLDLEGTVVWTHHLGVPQNIYGHASSLITSGGRLFVQYDEDNEANLFCFDTRSGDILWKTARDVFTSWASPIVVNTGSRMEIILSANPIVAGYDTVTGKELWSVDCLVGEVGPSPCYAGGRVFAANQFASLVAIDTEKEEVLWEFYDELPDVASPCATAEYLFLATSYGVICCLSTETGEVYWTEEYDEGFYSSPIMAGDRVYALDRKGVMRIVKAGQEYTLLASPEIGEKTVSTPAFYRSKIFIRSAHDLFCIGGNDASQ
jgi:outer membrane protein assembly factor BamB